MNDNNWCEHYMRPVAREAENEIYNLLMSDTRKQGFFGEALDEKSHIALQRAEVGEIIWRHWMKGEREHKAQFPDIALSVLASEKRVKELERKVESLKRIGCNCDAMLGFTCPLHDGSWDKSQEAPHEP